MKKFFIYTLLLIFGISLFADESLLDNDQKFSVENGSYKVVFTYTNLLPLNYQKKNILFTVYKNGIKYDTQTIKDVLKNPKGLQKTASYYYWGTCKAIYEKGIILDTVEGYKIYNFEAKKFLSLTDKSNAVFWTQKDLIHHSLEKITTNGSIENYNYFDYDSNVGHIVAATYGRTERRASSPNYKKPVSISAPLLYWSINNAGLLTIARDSADFTKSNTHIYKIYIDEKFEIAYAIQNNQFVRYKYTNND